MARVKAFAPPDRVKRGLAQARRSVAAPSAAAERRARPKCGRLATSVRVARCCTRWCGSSAIAPVGAPLPFFGRLFLTVVLQNPDAIASRERIPIHLSPPRGERSSEARVRGRAASVSPSERPLIRNLLPARGEKECADASRERISIHLSPPRGERSSEARVRARCRESGPGGEAPLIQPSPRARGEGVRRGSRTKAPRTAQDERENGDGKTAQEAETARPLQQALHAR